MSGIGRLVIHRRYGKARVVQTWRKLIDPIKKITRLDGLTMVLLTEEGRMLFRRDRKIFFVTDKPLPRCYEGNLDKVTLYEEPKQTL